MSELTTEDRLDLMAVRVGQLEHRIARVEELESGEHQVPITLRASDLERRVMKLENPDVPEPFYLSDFYPSDFYLSDDDLGLLIEWYDAWEDTRVSAPDDDDHHRLVERIRAELERRETYEDTT